MNSKKILSAVMATGMGAMAMASAVPAFAAPSDVTISVPAGDSHSYDVYQIMTGDYDSVSGQLSNILWGANGKEDVGTRVSSAVLTDLATVVNAANDPAKLAVIEKYVDLNKAAIGTVNKDTPLTVAPGYYLVKDTDGTVTGEDTYTLYIVKVGGDTVISRKAAETRTPTVDKDVMEGAGYANGADASVGDTISFRLTGTIADNYADYAQYKYSFVDTLSAGLDYTAGSVKVMVGATDITDKFTVDYTGHVLTVACADLKQIAAIDADSQIVVTYDAVLNDSAVEGSAGNKNTVKVVYSNNPNAYVDGTPVDPDSVSENTPDPDDNEVHVYTYKLVINKVDAEANALAGAGFTLERYMGQDVDDNEIWTAVGAEVRGAGADGNVFTWDRIDSGKYRLTETTTPAGYNTIDPVEFTITATIDANGDLTGLASSLTGAKIEVSTGEQADMNGTADATTGAVAADVVNVKGTKLPTTGAMGVIMLMGGATVILGGAAGIRMHNRKEQ